MDLQDKILQIKNFLPTVKLIPAILSDDFDFVEHQLLNFLDYFDEVEFDIVKSDFQNISTSSEVNSTLKLQNYLEILSELEISNTIKSNFHLMTNYFLPEFEELDQNMFSDSEFTIHVESEFFQKDNWMHKFSRFDEWNIGFAINPETEIKEILKLKNDWDKFWEKYDEKRKLFDYLQIMTVTPGSQGMKFETKVLAKIKDLKKNFKNTKLRVDGGINPTNLENLSDKELTILKSVDEVCVGSFFSNQV